MNSLIKLCLIFSTTATLSCSSLLNIKEPKVELDQVKVTDPNITGATLIFVLDVQNPNDRVIKVDEVAYKVFLNNSHFATAKTDKVISVPANASSKVELPLPVEFTKLWSGLGELLTARSVTYRIEGDAKMAGFKIPFNKDGKLELR